MISDVLSDALAEIERNQTDPVFAHCYARPTLAAHIEAVKQAMRDLLRVLDTPPSLNPEVRCPATVTMAKPPEVPNLDSTWTMLDQTYWDIDGMAGEVREYVETELVTVPSARRREAWKTLAHALDHARIAVIIAQGEIEGLQALEDDAAEEDEVQP